MKGKTFMEVGDDGVAIITINNPPLNLLSIDVLLSLKETSEQALQRDDVKAIVITGSNGKFSGGFDVSAFGKKGGRGKYWFWSIDFITDTLEAARKPLVAAIDGLALGGGLEIGLACHARISTSLARLGLPELKYGILPGFGGTQRLPRLVGLSNALDMILMSKLVNGDYAQSLGLVDAIASPEEMIKTACRWALDILECKKPWSASLYRNDRLEPLAEARMMIKLARVKSQKQSPNLKHLLVCIDVIEEGIISGARAALWKEAKDLQQLRESDTCKSLVHFFFAQQGTSKIPGITDLGLVPRKVNRIAIIGGGLVGSGIATVLILSKHPVILKESNEQDLLAGINRIKENLYSSVKKGRITNEDLDEVLCLLKGVLDYESFRDVDLVIEAASENISLKQQIFADLEKYCPHHCMFASTTSTVNLKLIGERTKSNNRIVGTHFFSPAYAMPVMEIVHNEMTSPQVIIDLLNVGKRIKKVPIVVSDCTGLAINWMFFPYSHVAMMLVECGVDIYQIDQTLVKFGMLMGPFRMIDHVGFEVATATSVHYMENFPGRYHKQMLISVIHEDNRAGEATGKGFYIYDNKNKACPYPAALRKSIDKTRSISGAMFDSKLMKLSDEEMVEMILFPVVNEACHLLEEGIVVKSSDLDVASVTGCGFPAYRGGIIFWANSLGSKYICSKLDEWSKIYGEFFKPCTYLAERASKGISLEKQVHAKSQL